MATLLAYQPALRGQFVWDDGIWTVGQDLVKQGFSGLRHIWLLPTTLQQYYPLTASSFWLDYQAWGSHPLPYHIENVLLHVCSAFLVGTLLRRLGVPGGWMAAAIFALHPVMVESVGWITERKNVLSGLLFLASLFSYAHYASFWQPGPDGDVDRPQANRRLAYLASLVLFLAAMSAKTTAFSLPAVILLLAWWKRGRIGLRLDVFPALPFFAVTLGFGLITAGLEKNHVGAMGPDWEIPFFERCQIAGRALWFYAAKLVWPSNLAFIYPRWHLDSRSFFLWLYPFTFLAVVLVLWFARNRLGRGPITAVLFFVGTLFPVLGFMNAYFMRFSFVCDHLVYVSSLGLLAVFAAVGTQILARVGNAWIPPVVGALILLALGLETRRHSAMFADNETLWRTTLTANPGAFIAWNNLGEGLFQKGRSDEAIPCFQKALELKPDALEIWLNLGVAFMQVGRPADAVACYQNGLRLAPSSVHLRYDFANALLRTGKLQDAINEFNRVVTLDPSFADAYNNLGAALKQAGDTRAAVSCYQRACDLDPQSVAYRSNLGSALLAVGRLDEAIVSLRRARELDPRDAGILQSLALALLEKGSIDEAALDFEQAIALQPDLAQASAGLGAALLLKGRPADAITHFEKALALQPGNSGVQARLAWVLATTPEPGLRNGSRAVQLAEQAEQASGGRNPAVLQTLAAAYAEVGRFDAAIESARAALALASARSNTNMVRDLESQLELYASGRPLRVNSRTPLSR